MVFSVVIMSMVGISILSAVTDDVVVAAVPRHRQALGDRVALADEIDDGFGAAAPGQCQHGLDLVAVGLHHMMRAASPGEFERAPARIDHDDLGRAQSLQDLDADMPEAAGADHHGIFAGQQMARGFLGGAIGRQTGVGVGSDILGRERLRQLDQTARAGQQILRIAAIGVDPGKTLSSACMSSPRRHARQWPLVTSG